MVINVSCPQSLSPRTVANGTSATLEAMAYITRNYLGNCAVQIFYENEADRELVTSLVGLGLTVSFKVRFYYWLSYEKYAFIFLSELQPGR